MSCPQFNKNATDRAKEDIKTVLKSLNDHLMTRCATLDRMFAVVVSRMKHTMHHSDLGMLSKPLY